MVRAGAPEALVEARFVDDGPRDADDDADDDSSETVLSRSVAPAGRSRAWVDGRMVTAAVLGERAQRAAGAPRSTPAPSPGHRRRSAAGPRHLRRRGPRPVSRHPPRGGRPRGRDVARLGGEEQERAREADFLRYQLEEIAAAAIADAEEDERLAAEEERLAAAAEHRRAAAEAVSVLADLEDSSALDRLAQAARALSERGPLAAFRGEGARPDGRDHRPGGRPARCRRHLGGGPGPPGRRPRAAAALPRAPAQVRARRWPTSSPTPTRPPGASSRWPRTSSGWRGLEAEPRPRRAIAWPRPSRRGGRRPPARRTPALGRRRGPPAAPGHGRRPVRGRSRGGRARPTRSTFWLGANRGEPLQPLARSASGGELARAMLALRLAVSTGPPVMVFDEVDAGVGGAAAAAVGAALAELGRHRQVLVVTHLAQVAAQADHQIAVHKHERDGRTRSEVTSLDADARVVEVSRMLSGRPESVAARRHARELLEAGRAGG